MVRRTAWTFTSQVTTSTSGDPIDVRQEPDLG
jgi:hypothetical protein